MILFPRNLAALFTFFRLLNNFSYGFFSHVLLLRKFKCSGVSVTGIMGPSILDVCNPGGVPTNYDNEGAGFGFSL